MTGLLGILVILVVWPLTALGYANWGWPGAVLLPGAIFGALACYVWVLVNVWGRW